MLRGEMMNSDKKYIVILLITTLLSVGIMIYFADTQNYLEYNYFIVEEEDRSLINNNDSSAEGKLQSDSVQDIEDERNDISLKGEEIIEEVLDDSEDSKYKEELENTEQEENSNCIDNDNRDILILEEEKSITVFKIDKNNIVNEISNKDKLKLLKMANSLSVSDYKALLDHVKRSDELLAAIDIFTLLKEKLSVNDYEKLTKILFPYIDIEMIENKINEK